jgi:hypothetical protein
MSSHQAELRENALHAGEMLQFALAQVRTALEVADGARANLGPTPPAELLAGALTVGDLKMRAALGFLEDFGHEAVDAIRALFGTGGACGDEDHPAD